MKMADIILSFRSVNELLDCFIFTKELSTAALDGAVQVVFNFEQFDHDGQSFCGSCQSVQAFLPRQTSLISNHVHCETADSSDKTPHQATTTESIFAINNKLSENNEILLCLNSIYKCILLMDAHLASCVAHQLRSDRKFRKSFWKYVSKKFGFIRGMNNAGWTKRYTQCGYLNTMYSLEVVSVFPKQKIDFSWYGRVHYLIRKRGQLEGNMAWLSTLGGGYSALGDYFTYCAEKAGTISIHQLKLAVQMSDPIMASKCQVFLAQSLLQQGHLRICKKIIRREYEFAKTNGVRDTKLENMCLSVWTRLQHLYKNKKTKHKVLPKTCS